MSKLVDVGLINRTKHRYRISSFGKVVFSVQEKAQERIQYATNNYWKLNAIDLIMNSSDRTGLPTQQYQTLMDKLLDNREIKTILDSDRTKTGNSKIFARGKHTIANVYTG